LAHATISMAWPFMPSAVHNQSTRAATSSGRRKRPAGLSLASVARASAALFPVLAAIRLTDAATNGVSVKPGHAALTVTPVGESSAASARASPTTPCLAAQYAATYG